MGIAQWTTYSGTNSLVRYADSMGMEWNDLELQCMAIDATLHNQNPYSGWYDTGMGKYYGVTKADFWEGDLYEATMAFFCCFEDPEEYRPRKSEDSYRNRQCSERVEHSLTAISR